MNWKKFWQKQAKSNNPLQQVGRKEGNTKQEQLFLESYAAYVAGQLNLNKNDILLDVCCGNGILTHYLAKHCKAVLGIDFSETNIDSANTHYSNDTTKFICVDALELYSSDKLHPLFVSGFTKSTLCFSFQYFESMYDGLKVVQGVFKHTQHQLFLADIPDKEFFFSFYNSPMKLLRLFKQFLFRQNDMGKFWSENELVFISKNIGATGIKINQPKEFPYSHYRMDYLLSK